MRVSQLDTVQWGKMPHLEARLTSHLTNNRGVEMRETVRLHVKSSTCPSHLNLTALEMRLPLLLLVPEDRLRGIHHPLLDSLSRPVDGATCLLGIVRTHPQPHRIRKPLVEAHQFAGNADGLITGGAVPKTLDHVFGGTGVGEKTRKHVRPH